MLSNPNEAKIDKRTPTTPIRATTMRLVTQSPPAVTTDEYKIIIKMVRVKYLKIK